MRILSKRTLREFWEVHTDCEQQLLGWYKEFKMRDFETPDEILKAFPNSRSIGKSRYVFEIKGNNYRLIVKISFELQAVWVRFIGTHADYDKINALEI